MSPTGKTCMWIVTLKNKFHTCYHVHVITWLVHEQDFHCRIDAFTTDVSWNFDKCKLYSKR